jgi:molecular chaperone HtpG
MKVALSILTVFLDKTMNEKKLSINTENILPIIKKWLYADREVFLRELIANAQDAISKRKIAYTSDHIDQISIAIDKEKKTITISDTGIGMTQDEIERYIAQIAFSGAEEFAKNYQNDKDAIIGHFGLGFYSSYMVAKSVEIFSLSFQEGASGAYWKCEGGVDYTLHACEKTEKGTTIVLHIAEDAEEFLDEDRLKGLLKTYCQFFNVNLVVNETPFSTFEPLWLKNQSQLEKQDYLDFYKLLYPHDQDPLFWVHINIDYPYHVKGILYFPKIGKSYDFQKSHISLYSNRVFVSDNCKDLLPDYLTVLKGCIDSPDIPLNVSRSYLQMDRQVRSLSLHISKKVTQVLQEKFSTDRESFEKNFEDIETVIKLGVLQDEKLFEKVEPFYLLKTVEGSFMTLKEATDLKENPTLYYTQDKNQHSGLLELFKKKQLPVFLLNSPLDSAILNTLEAKLSCKFSRLDGSLPQELCEDEEQESSLLEPYFEGVSLKLKRFESKTLPGLYVVNESMRRFKEYMQLSKQGDLEGMNIQSELVLNTNSPIVSKLLSLTDPEEKQKLSSWIKKLVSLSQNLLSPQDLGSFIEESALIFEHLSPKQDESSV